MEKEGRKRSFNMESKGSHIGEQSISLNVPKQGKGQFSLAGSRSVKISAPQAQQASQEKNLMDSLRG